MMYFIWFLWMVMIMGLTITLLNLLVSILGTVYGEMLEDQTVMKYDFRCLMIGEAARIKQFVSFYKKQTRSKVSVLQYCILDEEASSADPNNTNEVLLELQTTFNTSQKKLKDKLNKMSSEISSQKTDHQALKTTILTEIKKLEKCQAELEAEQDATNAQTVEIHK